MKRKVKVTDWGIRLDNKFGITGVMVAELTDDQIQANHDNAKKRVRSYCTIQDLETGYMIPSTN